MRPPAQNKLTFEKVAIGEFVLGEIEEVQYDKEHKFKGFEGKPDTVQMAVRLKLKLQGYEFPHYTRWGKFSMGEKSNLYSKYIVRLVENAKPDMDFDLDELNGMQIKTVWSENGDFQNLDMVYPIGKKKVVTELTGSPVEPPVVSDNDFIPELDEEESFIGE